MHNVELQVYISVILGFIIKIDNMPISECDLKKQFPDHVIGPRQRHDIWSCMVRSTPSDSPHSFYTYGTLVRMIVGGHCIFDSFQRKVGENLDASKPGAEADHCG